MNITEELRKWARQFRHVWVDPHSGDLTYITNEHACPPSLDAMRLEDYITAIADRIDERVKNIRFNERHKGYQDGIMDGCSHYDPERTECMVSEEHDYIKLPVDADGEPIHVGDVMEWPTTGETFEVVGIGDGTLFYIEDGSELADWTGASTKRHHHVPTVEDELLEFADRYAECADEANWQDIVADFAQRLQLREDV